MISLALAHYCGQPRGHAGSEHVTMPATVADLLYLDLLEGSAPGTVHVVRVPKRRQRYVKTPKVMPCE